MFPEFFGTDLTCIEIGCGTGATINRVAGKFKNALGVDIYDYAAPFNEQRQKNNVSNTRFLQCDLEKQDLNETFDRLISFEVIEHLQSEDSVSRYASVLNDGGLAAITVPNKWWIFETHGARLPLLPWNRVPFFSWLPRPIHERFANARIYTLQRIISLLQKHGFTVLNHQYVTAPMDVLKEGWLKRKLVKYLFRGDSTRVPILSTSIFVMAKKTGSSKHA
jgi:cyclopropane fatty-acyl-phospholipid synthase-like methyltransferase